MEDQKDDEKIAKSLGLEREDVELARRIWMDNKQYKSIPSMESRDSYRDMVEFSGTVNDPELSQSLEIALDGKGAFGRFNDLLLDYPKERERWFEFKDEKMEERIIE